LNSEQTIARRSRVVSILFACAGVIALAVYLRLPDLHSWLLPAAALALSVPGSWIFACRSRRLKAYGWTFGLLFVALQICGERIAAAQTLARTPAELWGLLVSSVGLAPTAAGLFARMMQALENRQPLVETAKKRLSPRAVFWGSTVILLLCWLPKLLAFYPGLFTYDISWQYQQYQYWELNTHHPLLHTLMVGGFCDLGWHLFGYPVKGLFLYTVFQMVVMAMAMASAIHLLYRHRAPTWLCVLLLVMDGVLPFHSLLVISSTKDTLFGGAVLYLSVVLAEMIWDRDALRNPRWMIRFVLAQAAVGLMRNNGFVCIAAIILVGAVGLIRHWPAARRLLALGLCGLVVYGASSAGLKAATNAQSGHIREMLSVPLQQLARTYTLTDDPAREEIAQWIPNVHQYSPNLADMVKDTFQAEGKDLPAFFALWAEVGLRHPILYADSMLTTGRGFYHIDAECTGQYLETRFHTDEARWMVPDSRWPELQEVMRRLYSNNEYARIPFYSTLLSPALWAWMMLLAFGAALYLRNHAVSLAGFASFALYLTILLSPCVMARYVYPLMLTGPFLLGGLLVRQK